MTRACFYGAFRWNSSKYLPPQVRFDVDGALVSTSPVSDNLGFFYFKFLLNAVLLLIYSLLPGLFLSNSLEHDFGCLICPILLQISCMSFIG